MGKAKRRKLNTHSSKPNRPLNHATKAPKSAPKQQQHTGPTIPFDPNDRMLLVGEGDFSFAASLAEHHGCADLRATSFDSEDELLKKYPQASEHIATLKDFDHSILYSVDATRLSQKPIRKTRPWDRIIFNFPHVGGKSTDVNRQVRYNQELLVSFFRAASPLLSANGTIVVTLFEGEPYTLWNVKDLARHTGLKVERSFKFQNEAYPGYKHARTLGNLERGGGWKGEERGARTYVFSPVERNTAPDVQSNGHAGTKRRKGGDSSDDEG